MTIFNASQKINAKIFYNLISQLDETERSGAIKALSILGHVVEDGFLTINAAEPRADFFVQCFDVLISTALSLKMLEDDGLVPTNMDHVRHKKNIMQVLDQAEAAFNRLETSLMLSPKPSLISH